MCHFKQWGCNLSERYCISSREYKHRHSLVLNLIAEWLFLKSQQSELVIYRVIQDRHKFLITEIFSWCFIFLGSQTRRIKVKNERYRNLDKKQSCMIDDSINKTVKTFQS